MNQYHTNGPIFEDELCTAYEEMAYDFDISPASAARPSTSIDGQSVAKNIHFNKPVYWEKGQTLKVAFYGGTDFQKEEVMKHSQEWFKWANLNFDFVASHPCDIDIAFKPGSSSSLRGTQYLDRSRATPPIPSMNLG